MDAEYVTEVFDYLDDLLQHFPSPGGIASHHLAIGFRVACWKRHDQGDVIPGDGIENARLEQAQAVRDH